MTFTRVLGQEKSGKPIDAILRNAIVSGAFLVGDEIDPITGGLVTRTPRRRYIDRVRIRELVNLRKAPTGGFEIDV